MKQLNGLILAGGKSQRMGRDKAFIDYHGKPQKDYLKDCLQALCAEVYVSVHKDIIVTSNEIVDRFDVEGPLNGILSAFAHRPDAAWLVVAVDMPNVDSKTLELLVRCRNRDKIATCFLNAEQNKPEPLLTIWEPSAKRHIEKFYQAGRISPRDFLCEHDVELVVPPYGDVLLSINTPEALREFRRIRRD